MTKTYWVYILTNESRSTLYIGMTNNIERRVFEHREGGGDSFAAKYRLRRVVYLEEFGEVKDAIGWEKVLKKWNRVWKEELIAEENPKWVDLVPEG